MGNKKTIFKISDLSSKLNEIKAKLLKEDINTQDVLNIHSSLDEISSTSSKIDNKSLDVFLKSNLKDINSNIQNLFGRIEEIEDKRQKNDEEILNRLHKILYAEDYLDLNFFKLNPSDIENILLNIEGDLKKILRETPYNMQIITPLIDEIKSKFDELNFRHSFPIVEELDERKESFAKRVIFLANKLKIKDPLKANLLTKKIDDLLDLVWIAKMFMYKDFEKAFHFYQNLDETLKDKIEKIIWKLKGITKNDIQKNEIYPYALMDFVADEINA